MRSGVIIKDGKVIIRGLEELEMFLYLEKLDKKHDEQSITHDILLEAQKQMDDTPYNPNGKKWNVFKTVEAAIKELLQEINSSPQVSKQYDIELLQQLSIKENEQIIQYVKATERSSELQHMILNYIRAYRVLTEIEKDDQSYEYYLDSLNKKYQKQQRMQMRRKAYEASRVSNTVDSNPSANTSKIERLPDPVDNATNDPNRGRAESTKTLNSTPQESDQNLTLLQRVVKNLAVNRTLPDPVDGNDSIIEYNMMIDRYAIFRLKERLIDSAPGLLKSNYAKQYASTARIEDVANKTIDGAYIGAFKISTISSAPGSDLYSQVHEIINDIICGNGYRRHHNRGVWIHYGYHITALFYSQKEGALYYANSCGFNEDSALDHYIQNICNIDYSKIEFKIVFTEENRVQYDSVYCGYFSSYVLLFLAIGGRNFGNNLTSDDLEKYDSNDLGELIYLLIRMPRLDPRVLTKAISGDEKAIGACITHVLNDPFYQDLYDRNVRNRR